MTNLEKLRTATPEQIADMFCDILCEDFGDCSDVCPRSIFERCATGKNGFEEWLNEEAETQKEEAKTPKDAPEDVPKGWIKLKTRRGVIYINVSKIVGVDLPDLADVSNGVAATVHTVGAEDDPWLVYDSVEEVMKKIGEASQEE